jgi:hypothetical protein
MKGLNAASHLLLYSRLGVVLSDYERDDGTIAWERLLTERGNSGSEVALIRIARCLAEGALGEASCLDRVNYDALLAALDVLAYGSHGGIALRAGRREL